MIWARSGNFNEEKYNIENGTFERRVTLVALTNQAVIRFVRIYAYQYGLGSHALLMTLAGTIFSKETIRRYILDSFNHSILSYSKYDNPSRDIPWINIKNTQDLQSLLNIFELLNHAFDFVIFNNELINEIRQMYNFQIRSLFNQSFTHQLNEKIWRKGELIPILNKTIFMLALFPDKDCRNKVRQLLIQGEDPREYDTGGLTCFFNAAQGHKKDPWLMEFLLAYDRIGDGAFSIDNSQSKNCFEIAKENDDLTLYELLASYVRNLRQPINHESQPLRAVVSSIQFRQRELVTYYQFNNNTTVITTLKNVSDLSAPQKEQMFSLFSSVFSIRNDPLMCKLRELFNDDLNDDTKIVEVITSQDKIIGFNLFKIVAEPISKILTLIIDYSLINECFRRYGLMSLHAFRLAYALQLLKPDYKIAVFFISVHFNSYKMIKDYLFFPKYQPAYMEALVKNILHVIYDSENGYVKKGILCHVREPLCVRGTRDSSQNDFQQKFFYQHMRGSQASSEDERGVPICFIVENDNFRRTSDLALRLNINLLEYIQKLTSAFGAFLGNATHRIVLSSLFYNPENLMRIRSDLQFWSHHTKIPENRKMSQPDFAFSLSSGL